MIFSTIVNAIASDTATCDFAFPTKLTHIAYFERYGFVLIEICIQLFCYIKTYKYLADNIGMADIGIMRYPLGFSIVWLSGAVGDFWSSFFSFAFIPQYIHVLLTRSVGLLNGILYGLQVLRAYRDKKRQELRSLEERTTSIDMSMDDRSRTQSVIEQSMLEEVLRI